MTNQLATLGSPFGNRRYQRHTATILVFGISFVTCGTFQPRQTFAGTVSADGLTDSMMEYQSEQLMMIGHIIGADGASPLSFSSAVDAVAMTYSFQLNLGSTYLGQSMTLAGSGAFNTATDTFSRSALGSLGAFHWTSAGTDSLGLIGLDGVQKSKSHEDFKDKDGNKFMDTEDEKEFNYKTGKSTVTVQLTKADGSNDGDPNEGRDKLLKDGTWILVTSLPQFDFEVVSTGFSPPGGGDGSFTSNVESVPEPATLAMLSTGVLASGMVIFARRRPKLGAAP